MDSEYSPLGLLIREGKFDFPINSTRSDESRVECLDPIGGHDDLDVTPGVEAIKLVEKLQHCPLDLPLTPAVALVPLSADSVNLINEDNAGRVFFGDTEEFSDQFRSITKVLLDQLTTNLAKTFRNNRFRTKQVILTTRRNVALV